MVFEVNVQLLEGSSCIVVSILCARVAVLVAELAARDIGALLLLGH